MVIPSNRDNIIVVAKYGLFSAFAEYGSFVMYYDLTVSAEDKSIRAE